MEHDSFEQEHLLQKYGILTEFDVINSTSLEDFMDTYEKIVNTSDDISELGKVSELLDKQTEIPGFVGKIGEQESNPDLDKFAYVMIEFLMKKTMEPSDWAYIVTMIIDKLGLEFDDDTSDDSTGE